MMLVVDAGLNLFEAESGFGGLYLCRRHAHEAYRQRSGDNRTRDNACYEVATIEPLCNQIANCSAGAVVDDHVLVYQPPPEVRNPSTQLRHGDNYRVFD